MGIRYDYAASILLCAEENTSFLGFDEAEDEEEDEKHWPDWSLRPNGPGFYGKIFEVFPLQSEECLSMLIEREAEHMPREDYANRLAGGYLDVSIREDAIDWILEVHAYYNFGPLTAYLSVNYLDRFLSLYDLPQEKSWMTQLLSVACLSLAAKMEEMEVPLLMDLQVGEAKFVFEARTIRRMELLLLSTLNWKMKSVTPFSFIEYFLNKLHGGDFPSELSISRAVKLVLSTIRGNVFLAFKPSEIAAATALWVMAGEAQDMDFEKTASCCSKIDKVKRVSVHNIITTASSFIKLTSCWEYAFQERVIRCYQVMQEEIIMAGVDTPNRKNGISSVACMPQSPIGVLDAARLSCKRDERTSDLQPLSRHSSAAEKRRKISMHFIS
ncbi:Cyclin-D3-1 [Platanthera zijinensis]|uniref:Cyclin-D3-1 n=1 Tax=Platanthera zijinensis TaxID=2320716 RepID=A0AAP0B7E5_9ASPA